MLQNLDIIASASLFEGLSEDQLRQIAEIAVKMGFQKGEEVFLEGDAGNGFYIVVQGRVKIFKASSEGKEHILHIFGPGEPIGEVSVFSGGQFPANAETITDSSLLYFARPAFVELISSNPALALGMLAVLSRRLREFTMQIENLSLKEVPARFAAYLLRLAEEQENDDSIVLNISKGQLAGLLGTIPETLSRIISGMSSQRLIGVKDRNIVFLDRAGLEELVDCGRYKDSGG